MVYTKYAFISYSHQDMAVAKWLQRRLEGYRLPTDIHNDIEAQSRYLRPVFRDDSDLDSGILNDELQKNLEESKFLIIICSHNSAQSKWVSDEARAFVEMGRLDRIIPVFTADAAGNEAELFPAYLREYFREHPGTELLGVSIGKSGRQKALVRVVSRMLGVSFDSLWKRHQRRRRIHAAMASALTAAVAAGAYMFAVPVELTISVGLQPSALPVGDEVVLRVDGGEYLSSTDASSFDTIRLLGYKRFSSVGINVSSPYFTTIDTVINTGYGVRRNVNIELKRDDTFAAFEGTVYDTDMRPLAGVKVTAGGRTAITDDRGHFVLSIPLEAQRAETAITLEKQGYKTVTRDDETPGHNLKFIMHGETGAEH